MFNFTQNIQVRQQWRWACNLWFCAKHNMGGLATLYTNRQQHTNTMSTANHSVSKYRNQAQKLEEKQSSKEIGSPQTDNGRVGWDHQIHTSRLPRMVRNHMYTRLYQVPCQLCLTTSLLATDSLIGKLLPSWEYNNKYQKIPNTKQMAFHMRDHASSLLFSLEEPLFHLDSVTGHYVLGCVYTYPDIRISGYPGVKDPDILGAFTRVGSKRFRRLHVSRYPDALYAAYSLCVGEIRKSFFLLVKLHAFHTLFQCFLSFYWCSLAERQGQSFFWSVQLSTIKHS